MSFYESDQSVLGRIATNTAAQAYRQSVQPQQSWVDLLNKYYDAYPQMDAATALAFAKAGIDPASKQAQEAAAASVEQKHHKGMFDRLGDVLSPISKLVGQSTAPAAHVAEAGMHVVDETLSPVVRTATRTAMIALETPLQEVQTYLRAEIAATSHQFANMHSATDFGRYLLNPLLGPTNVASYEVGAGSSSGRESIGDLIAGKKVDVGSGFLPSGQVEETVKTKANQLTLNVGNVQLGGPGHPSISVGRVAAAFVSEPGSRPFNIISGLTDAGVAWYGDPSMHVGELAKEGQASTRVGRAISAGRDEKSLGAALGELRTPPTFTALNEHTGQLPGIRNTVDATVADGWVSKGGRRVVDKIAATPDFYTLWEATKRKLPVDMTVKLADATTPQEVMDIIRPAIGTELTATPEFIGFRAKRANSSGFRMAQEMPGHFLDPNDLNQATDQMDRWLRNAKVPPEIRNAAVEKIARSPGRESMVATLSSVMGDVADHLVNTERPLGAAPITPERARSLTRMWSDDIDKTRAYFTDEIAANRKAAGVMVDGNALEVQSPFLFSEYLDSVVPMPDPREMRRATSTLAKLVDNPYFTRTVDGIDAAQVAWKKAALLRGAYTVRVVGEEQIRMAASGLDSLFAHPISAIAALTGGDSKIAKALGTGKIRQADVLGANFYNDLGEAASIELKGALNRGWSGWAGDDVFDRGYTIFNKLDDGYSRAWAQSIGEMYSDPIARRVAGGTGNIEQTKTWFWSGDGKEFRKRLVLDHPGLATKDGAAQYIDTLHEGLKYRTGTDPVLLDAIATGQINGEKIGATTEGGRWKLNPALEEHMAGVNGPEAVKGQALTYSSKKAKVWDNATGWAFSHLMTKPTNYLSRSASFRERYWQRVEEMVPFMDDATRAQALKGAEGVVDGNQFSRMAAANSAKDRTITDITAVDTLAKKHGLEETKQLLYDLSDKGQFFDAMRLIFPFGEAWKEVLTRWAKIGMENPKVVRRGQQIITGARGNGFFHKDVNGQEVFTYPFSRHLTKTLTGIPFDINGRVAGLSLMTEVLPGVGPVVQLPAAALLPETPDWNFARQIISPYGEQDYSGGILESFLPGYAKNIAQFFKKGDPRLFANTVGATGDYLASTGDYDLTDPESVKTWVDDSRSLAKKVYMLRGLVQFGAPTAPMPEFLVKVTKGSTDKAAADAKAGKFSRGKAQSGEELAIARVVLEDFYRMQQDPDKGGVGYDNAVGEFLNRYGKGVLTMTRGKSISIPPKLPVTKASAEWAKTHGDVVHDYGLTWGLFAPQGGDDFDYVEYARQFKLGDKGRVSITPEQRLSLAQASVGRYLYDQAQTKVSAKPSKGEREWLALVKAKIAEEYPGYKQIAPGLPGGASTDQVISELNRAVADPRLAKSQLARVTQAYLLARTRALAYATEAGVKSLDAAAAAPARTWLGQVGAALAKKYPEFQQMFDTVFSREVT